MLALNRLYPRIGGRVYLAFNLVLMTGLLLSQYLFGFYQDKPKGIAKLGSRWAGSFAFTPPSLGRPLAATLILASFASMFLELLLIRWVSSEIRIFAYFKNFVLVACFFGFGLGCYFSKRRINLLTLILPMLYMAAVMKIPWSPLRNLIANAPSMLGSSSQLAVWGVNELASSWRPLTTALALTAPLFVMLAFIFLPLGQIIGWCLENSPSGLTAYSANVGTSLLAILAFTGASFLNSPPVVWLTIFSACLLGLLWKAPRLRAACVTGLLPCIGLAAINAHPGAATYWSPYQKLTLTPINENGELISYELTTNDSWYQRVVNFSPPFVAKHPELFASNSAGWDPYNLPYRFYASPATVLVLGSGMGNDVAAAVRNTTGAVVAVEIDPTILRLGKTLHFEKPYDSSRVRVVLDDARSFLHNDREGFDLIVFSLLDSHTTNSNYSNIRIDNYVYTIEAMREARRLLNPGGLLMVKFQVTTPWIAGRLKALLTEVFGQKPIQILADSAYVTPGSFFISGSQSRIANVLSDPAISSYISTHGGYRATQAVVTTDDWPYFYQKEPGIPLNVLLVSSLVVLLAFWFKKRTSGQLQIQWHFFLLGAGFLLLEVQIISKIALLFGTTWLVNSFVISTLLLFIMAANWTVQRFKGISTWFAYVAVLTSCVIAYFVPIEAYFFESVVLRALCAMTILCSPAYFAGIIFAKSYAAARFDSAALSSNILGALCGGIVESLSFWTGIRSLVLVALIFYLFSALFLVKRTAVKPASLEMT